MRRGLRCRWIGLKRLSPRLPRGSGGGLGGVGIDCISRKITFSGELTSISRIGIVHYRKYLTHTKNCPGKSFVEPLGHEIFACYVVGSLKVCSQALQSL